MVNPFAAPDPLQYLWLLMVAVCRDQHGYWLADNFFSRVAEELLRPRNSRS